MFPESEPCSDTGGGTDAQMRGKLAFPVLDPLEAVRKKAGLNCL
jgi:hypothetical protein